jgi:hypothetical protein
MSCVDSSSAHSPRPRRKDETVTPEQLEQLQNENRARVAAMSRDLERYDMAAYAAGFAPDSRAEHRPLGSVGSWYRVGPAMVDPITCVARLLNAIADRAEMVLPSAPLPDAMRALEAIARFTGGDESARADVIASTVHAGRMTADEAAALTASPLLAPTPVDGYLNADTSTSIVGGPATSIRPRADGTIKGRLKSDPVIGSWEPWDSKRAVSGCTITRGDHHELTTRGNMALRADGAEDLANGMGTDVQQWAQVIDWHPITVDVGDRLTVNGRPFGAFILAPELPNLSNYANSYGTSGSIVGSLETVKKRSGWQRTAVTYGMRETRVSHERTDRHGDPVRVSAPFPIDVEHCADWHRNGDAYRIVKRYETTAALRAPVDGKRYPTARLIGHGHWQPNEPRGVKRATRDKARTLSHDDALALCESTLSEAYHAGTDVSLQVVTTDGYRLDVRHEHAARAFRVSVTTPDKSRTSRKVARLATASATLRRLAS